MVSATGSPVIIQFLRDPSRDGRRLFSRYGEVFSYRSELFNRPIHRHILRRERLNHEETRGVLEGKSSLVSASRLAAGSSVKIAVVRPEDAGVAIWTSPQLDAWPGRPQHRCRLRVGQRERAVTSWLSTTSPRRTVRRGVHCSELRELVDRFAECSP